MSSNLSEGIIPTLGAHSILPPSRTAGTNTALEKILRNVFSANFSANTRSDSRSATEVKPKLNAPTLPQPPTQNPGALSRDIKAQLLLIQQITQTLLKPLAREKNAARPAKPPTSADNFQSGQKDVRGKVRQVALSPRQQQAVQQIQQNVIAAIARIQLQQSQSLLQQQVGSDSKSPGTLLQLEIPVQHQGDFHNLRLQIEEEYSQKEDENREAKQAKRWRVNLSIELGNAGRFYACVTHLNDETEVQLWADQQQTAATVRDKLDQLKQRLCSQGIQVKNLSCEYGAPLRTDNQLNCALVDVTT